MVRKGNAQAKNTALALTALTVALCCVPVPAVWVGIADGAPLTARLLYPLFHVNVVHAAVNAWALLCLVFYYEARLWQIVVAYAVAVSFPASALGSPLTLGMSGLCFALMGMNSYRVRRKAYWQVWMWAFIAVGFLLPHVNAMLHLYCYAVGLCVGLLGMPTERRKE